MRERAQQSLLWHRLHQSPVPPAWLSGPSSLGTSPCKLGDPGPAVLAGVGSLPESAFLSLPITLCSSQTLAGDQCFCFCVFPFIYLAIQELFVSRRCHGFSFPLRSPCLWPGSGACPPTPRAGCLPSLPGSWKTPGEGRWACTHVTSCSQAPAGAPPDPGGHAAAQGHHPAGPHPGGVRAERGEAVRVHPAAEGAGRGRRGGAGAHPAPGRAAAAVRAERGPGGPGAGTRRPRAPQGTGGTHRGWGCVSWEATSGCAFGRLESFGPRGRRPRGGRVLGAGALLLTAEEPGWRKLRVATWALTVRWPGFWRRPGGMELLRFPHHTWYFLVLSGPQCSLRSRVGVWR